LRCIGNTKRAASFAAFGAVLSWSFTTLSIAAKKFMTSVPDYLLIETAFTLVQWAIGAFEERSPPHKLVYTWRLDPPAEARRERVTVRFEPRGEDTEVIVVHERIVDEPRAMHEHGWLRCLLSALSVQQKPFANLGEASHHVGHRRSRRKHAR